ncbi:MAG TPA: ADP-ribosylglycohydrolase family protein, partial [Phycisphaerae bacterium]|nr:ADP-ribosylglycohydrolase family protein [Phycisphaerae bacterium]
ADWAGLCAAAIAAAFEPEANGWTVVNSVRHVAFEHTRDVFYKLDRLTSHIGWLQPEGDFIECWRRHGSAPLSPLPENQWPAYDPVSAVLPLLPRFAGDARRLLAMLLAPPPFMNVTTVSATIGGAIAGALHGPAAFPRKWLRWAEPIAQPWFALTDVVRKRIRREAKVISTTARLAEAGEGEESLLKQKVRGCILAGAIGNAMGSPVEGRQYWEIDKQHPHGVTTVLEPSRLESEDDNQMAMHLVETYLARDGAPVMARHFGKTWQERLNRNHFYPFCMGHAYDLICRGWDPRVVGHWQVVTGSTVMCMEPVGIYHLADPDFAAIDATAVSYMYQRGLDVTAAAMLAATVAEAFRPEATVDTVCRAALRVAPKSRLLTFDKRAFRSCHHYLSTCLDVADKYTDVLAARAELYKKCLLYHMIDPLELWGFALAMFKIAGGDVRQAAIGGTNIGRDSDTIAGRAAMLAGTLKGAGNVPGEWVAMFPDAALRRIDRNAERLADLITKGKLPLLAARQRVAKP